MDALAFAYGSDEEDGTSSGSPKIKDDKVGAQLIDPISRPVKFDVKPVNCAPTVPDKVTYQQPAVDPNTKEITYNPTYDELFAPQVRRVSAHLCAHKHPYYPLY